MQSIPDNLRILLLINPRAPNEKKAVIIKIMARKMHVCEMDLKFAVLMKI